MPEQSFAANRVFDTVDETEERRALVFDVKRFAINDGPGIRITIFLKGCPLSCRWCHNPESISTSVQKMYSASKCIGCGECVKICPLEACELTPEGVVTETEICSACGLCADVCPAKATEMSGQYETVTELIKVIEKERPFFDQSGGGVTFSGGEPLLYPKFLNEILDACGELRIHRTVDTSGLTTTGTLLETAKRTDLFLYDLKLMNSVKHKDWTGVGNRRILQNLQALAETGADIQIRIPLIKGVNADEDNIEATASFVAALPGPRKRVSLLPYHDVAEGKSTKLGMTHETGSMSTPDNSDLERIVDQFAFHGLTATVGG
ncbi:MAG: glycyl-radical enzyme activating protein [Gammaproteobacteria bacterium]|nr:glycyl-radical enzyme activating protein [Gammaproteobacteria bacterium]